jgi:uroporphyrin-III C-methyltransferase
MQAGKAFLVGAGPGDPELLTVKAVKVLRSADLVLYDSLVSPDILALVPPGARRMDVGKRCGVRSTPQEEINRLLVEHSLMGLQVVRLKGGDPFIFGRGGEELEALRQAGVETEVVPGITAALGAAALTQIPLTHRELSSTLILVTGHSRNAEHIVNWPDALPQNATIVVYMPGHHLSSLQHRLVSSGVAPETPCAIISGATLESQQIHLTSVAELLRAPRRNAPRLLVVGEVVRFAESRQLYQQCNEFSLGIEYSETSPNTGEGA